MIRHLRLRHLIADTRGSVLLEAAIVLPVVGLFALTAVEVTLIANARQLANHAAFSAARTAAVRGCGATSATRLAAALVMSSISSGSAPSPAATLRAFNLPDPERTAQTIGNLPGFSGGDGTWLERLALAHLRTSTPICDTGTVPGKRRRHVTVDVTYIYRCAIVPLGLLWGHAGLDAQLSYLRSLPEPAASYAGRLDASRRWCIPIHGRAVVEYWGE